jgi:hypothetical protein
MMGSRPVILSGNTTNRSIRSNPCNPDPRVRGSILFHLTAFLLLIVAPVAIVEAQTGTGIWKQRPVPATPAQKYVFIDFADSLHGWVMSADGYYSMTDDGGRTWGPTKAIPAPPRVVAVKRYGEDSAMAVVKIDSLSFEITRFLRTTDRGATWSTGLPPDSTRVTGAISIVNPVRIGYILWGGRLGTSTDLGSTWRVDSLPALATRGPMGMGILSSGRIFFTGGSGLAGTGFLWWSTDSGRTCGARLNVSGLNSVTGRYMSPELCYFNYGYGDEYPGGGAIAYNAILDSSAAMPKSSMGALFRDGSMFTVLMGSTMAARSVDPLDSSYTIAPYPASGIRIADMLLLSPHLGWVLDESGRVFQRIDVLTSVPGEGGNRPEQFELLQNYPNPFNPRTTVRYTLPAAGVVDLRVTDVLGREVYRSVENQPAGVKNRPIDLSRCASGIYYCTVRFGGGAQTIKMALVW